jgi:hypothetical protein
MLDCRLDTLFQKVEQLELSANAALDLARTFTRPTNAEEDTALQRFIQQRRECKKVLVEHCQLVVYQHQ